MPTFAFSQDEINNLVTEIKNQLVPVLVQELKEKQLPPMLTRQQFMELAGIGEAKCAELFRRSDFPVNRELGNPRVPTKLFFDWFYSTTENQTGLNLKYTAS